MRHVYCQTHNGQPVCEFGLHTGGQLVNEGVSWFAYWLAGMRVTIACLNNLFQYQTFLGCLLNIDISILNKF